MKKYLYSIMLLALSTVVVSCSNGDSDADDPIIDPTYGATGLLILNEGNYYSGINGSVSYLNYKEGTMTNDVFQYNNDRSLGGTPNDMVEVDERLYICCTDENRLEIAYAPTCTSISYISVNQPREVCADESGVYVSSYDGTVRSFDFKGNLIAQSDTIGSCLEGLTVRNGYVYVCNAYNPDYTYNTNVVKLKTGTLKKVKDITVACNTTQIEYEGGFIYVLSTGNYADVKAQIQTIDENDNVAYLCEATHMAVDCDTIYAINSVTDWTTYETKTEYFKVNGKTGKISSLISTTDAQNIFSPCAIAVDASNGYFFISSYSQGSTGYADYSGKGYIMQFKYDGTFVKRYDVGVGPATMVPHIEQIY